MRASAIERCVGTYGHPYIPGGKEHESSRCLCAKGSMVNCMPCCQKHGVFMVNVMANRKTSELGGEGVAVCPEGLISWGSLQNWGSVKSWSSGDASFSLVTTILSS